MVTPTLETYQGEDWKEGSYYYGDEDLLGFSLKRAWKSAKATALKHPSMRAAQKLTSIARRRMLRGDDITDPQFAGECQLLGIPKWLKTVGNVMGKVGKSIVNTVGNTIGVTGLGDKIESIGDKAAAARRAALSKGKTDAVANTLIPRGEIALPPPMPVATPAAITGGMSKNTKLLIGAGVGVGVLAIILASRK